MAGLPPGRRRPTPDMVPGSSSRRLGSARAWRDTAAHCSNPLSLAVLVSRFFRRCSFPASLLLCSCSLSLSLSLSFSFCLLFSSLSLLLVAPYLCGVPLAVASAGVHTHCASASQFPPSTLVAPARPPPLPFSGARHTSRLRLLVVSRVAAI